MLDALHWLEHNRDRIKAHQLFLDSLLAAKLSGRASHRNFLAAINIAVWRTELIRSPALHFDNDQPVRASPLPGDEIQLMKPAAAAPISFDDEISFAL